MDIRPAHALIRFGLGRAATQALPTDPMRWLSQQITQPDPAPALLQPGGGPTVTDGLVAVEMDRVNPAADGAPRQVRPLFVAEQLALLDNALTTDAAYRERLVWFWANHFTISLRQGNTAALAGAYVREAIRPHVTGRFSDMLLAVMRHPAMLLYLDNAGSMGPNSVIGGRQRRGLNENLARECLELHTVTPGSGYTQADVTEFARVLTGWTVERRENPLGYRFRPGMHEPGDKTVLGHRVPEGEQGGIELLAWLAEHPMTHRALAVKLARHFVADTPPADAIRAIEGALRDTRGNLGAAALAVTKIPAAWTPLQKLRNPQDYVVAAMRTAGLPAPKRVDGVGVMAGLGQPLFNAPAPIGWPDRASEWAGPEAMLRRVDWAYGFSGRADLPEPAALAEVALGPLLSEATGTEMRRAGSRRDGITLLFASPEFQRR